jgi:hypothetical protein
MKMHKKGVEVSINFIVMFILAMVVFASGLAVMRNIFGDAESAKEKIEQQQKEEMERYLCDGSEKVKLIYASLDMKKGEGTFAGLCIRNDFDSDKSFYIKAYCDAAYNGPNSEICNHDTGTCTNVCDNWLSIDDATYTIYPNEIKKIQDLSVMIPQSDVAKGTYVFNIKICEDNSIACIQQYGTTKKLHINIG